MKCITHIRLTYTTQRQGYGFKSLFFFAKALNYFRQNAAGQPCTPPPQDPLLPNAAMLLSRA